MTSRNRLKLGRPTVDADTEREQTFVIVSIEHRREAELATIIEALDDLALLFRPAQGREQQSGQNRDDGDDHEQLNEGEAVTAF